jgi:signal transduction histidine kinase
VVLTLATDEDANGKWAVLRVKDLGVGIPTKDLPRVFDRFYRGTNVAGKIPGSGIGLAGARQIIEQHGGTITAESREGIGSTFTVRLPLRDGGEGRPQRAQYSQYGGQR